jgi:hypothetical protein
MQDGAFVDLGQVEADGWARAASQADATRRAGVR